jgi:cysteine-rich secretory family protein
LTPAAPASIFVLLIVLCAPPLHAQKAPSPADLRKAQLEALAREARGSLDKSRLEAWEKLLSSGEDGVKLLAPIVAEKLDRDRRSLEEWFKGPHMAAVRRKVEESLVERRKEALACIFDRKRYPEENHGAVGQPEVDRLVDLVRKVWDHPAVFARTLFPDADALARALEEDVVYLETCGGKAPAELDSVDHWLARFDEPLACRHMGITQQQIEWNDAIEKYHAEELLTSADPEELACMQATNAYRRMMGMKSLEIDERLVRAGRKHSEEMKSLGYFAHDSPVAENKSPGLRCAREGYPGAGAENIAAGMQHGEGAFEGWYRSSGHHRNLLGGHSQIGVGRCETLWTQDFGGSSSLRGRRIDDPSILYLGKLKKLDPKSAESEVALALWCHSQRLDDKVELHARAAIALEPDNERAHALLGEVKQGGTWVQVSKPEKHPGTSGGAGRPGGGAP